MLHLILESRNYSTALERSEFGRVWESINPSEGYASLISQITKASPETEVIIDSSKLLGHLKTQHGVAKALGLPFEVYVSYRPLAKIMASSFKNGNIEKDAYINASKYGPILEYCLEEKIKPIVVNTECLLNEPKSQVVEICKWLSIDYFDGKEQYWEYQHCHLFGNALQGRQIRGDEQKGFLSARPEPKVDHLSGYPELQSLDITLSRLSL